MKSLVILVVLVHHVLCRIPITDPQLEKLSSRLEIVNQLASVTINQDDITLLIYTQANSTGTEIPLTDANRVTEVSQFDLQLKTVFFVHGWQSTVYANNSPIVRDALLQSTNVNVILVNWDECATNIDYFVSKSCVPDVGKYVGDFLETFSQTYSYSLSDITILGHSLGAHIAGHIGKNTNGALSVIVGLDPAGPLYSKDNTSERLAKGDAQFVEAIHTDSGGLGISFNVGDADYWPNGGYIQPGCTVEALCAHKRAWRYYIESLSNNAFYAKQCGSYLNYEVGTCATNAKSLMGGINVDTTATGTYYLDTNAESPFAKGDV